MAQDKIAMPSSQGGLMRHFDDYKSKVSLRPGHVVVLVVLVMVIILILHAYGGNLLT